MYFRKRDYLSLILLLVVIIYSLLAFYYFFSRPPGGGDESLFISDLELIKEKGWVYAIKKNVSIPYMLLTYPLCFFVKTHLALRIVNLVLLGTLFVYFYKTSCKHTYDFYVYMMFYVSTIGFFYAGINDVLFVVCLIVFFNEINNILNDKKSNVSLLLSALVIAFFTRQLFLVYLPVIVLGIYILYKSKLKLKNNYILPLLIVIFFLIFNLPSLIENKTLSFDKKSPAEGVTWSQRQYLAQIMVNENKLENWQHPSWEQTKQYLELNGENALPKTVLESITHNYVLTIKEFFKDLAYSLYFSVRQTGLMLFFSILFVLVTMHKTRKIDFKYFIPVSTIIMLMVFSLIIISYVELRWLIPVFVMTIVYYDDLVKFNKLSSRIAAINNLTMIFLSIYGMFKLLINY